MDKGLNFNDFLKNCDIDEDQIATWIHEISQELTIPRSEDGQLQMDYYQSMDMNIALLNRITTERLRKYHEWLIERL